MAIFKYFNCLLVSFFSQLADRLEVAQLASTLINERNHLYQAIFPLHKKALRVGSSSRRSNQKIQEDDEKRKEMREMLNYETDKCSVYDRIEREVAWRESLKIGDELDAISKYKTPHSTSYHYI